MKTETYDRLKKLYNKHGSREFGKLCQKFLAIAFKMAGYCHVVERGVQGVDIDAARTTGGKYAIEVKTTLSASVNFQQKDADGLEKGKRDGYQPVLAVLRLHRFSEWLLAKADTIRPASIYIDSLRVYRLRELEAVVSPLFDEAVKEHFRRTMEEGQGYLDSALKQKRVCPS